MAKNKHLTDEERLQIENLLRQRCSLKFIAQSLGKSTSTVSREVRKRANESEKFAAHYPHNRCINRRNCHRCQLCEDKPNCTRRCALCNRYNSICPSYEEEVCTRLYDPPYVCNGCPEEYRCALKKRYYLHRQAHEAYREMLIESRIGANITEEELLELDGFVSPLIKQGQSVHHIFANNPDEFAISEKSVYRTTDILLWSLVVIITLPAITVSAVIITAVTFCVMNHRIQASTPPNSEPIAACIICFLPKPRKNSASGFTPIGIYSFSSML